MSVELYERKLDGSRVVKTVPETTEVVSPNNTTMVDSTSMSIAYLDGSDIHNNGPVVNFASDDLGSGWNRSANVFEYTGPCDAIIITANIAATDTGASSYWGRPSLRITNGDGDIVGEMDDLAMQQNGAYSGNVQITGTINIKNPSNKEFTFTLFDTDNRTSTLTPIPSSHVALKAVKSVEVYAV